MSYDDRRLAVELRRVIDQITVPARPLRTEPTTRPVRRSLRVLGAAGILLVTLVIGLSLGQVVNTIRIGSRVGATATTPQGHPFPEVAEPQLFILPPGCVLVGSPMRSADGAETRWQTTCRGGPWTPEAERASVREFVIGQGWQECASDDQTLQFVRGAFAMSIEGFAPESALIISQRIANSGCH